MSTKNLARTIIEGGRNGYNKSQRKHSHTQERALARAHVIDGMRLADGFDGLAIGKRPKVYKSFADKLGAPRRWLRSHVGRPWSVVRSEMFERFDPRTIAGQHILFDHMLREVRMPSDNVWRHHRGELFVDAHGMLRMHTSRARERRIPWSWKCAGSPCGAYGCEGVAAVTAFTAGRRIGGHGAALYWFTSTGMCKPRVHEQCCCPRPHDGRVIHETHQHYRQSVRLTDQENAFWAGLCEWHKAEWRHVPAERGS